MNSKTPKSASPTCLTQRLIEWNCTKLPGTVAQCEGTESYPRKIGEPAPHRPESGKRLHDRVP